MKSSKACIKTNSTAASLPFIGQVAMDIVVYIVVKSVGSIILVCTISYIYIITPSWDNTMAPVGGSGNKGTW